MCGPLQASPLTMLFCVRRSQTRPQAYRTSGRRAAKIISTRFYIPPTTSHAPCQRHLASALSSTLPHVPCVLPHVSVERGGVLLASVPAVRLVDGAGHVCRAAARRPRVLLDLIFLARSAFLAGATGGERSYYVSQRRRDRLFCHSSGGVGVVGVSSDNNSTQMMLHTGRRAVGQETTWIAWPPTPSRIPIPADTAHPTPSRPAPPRSTPDRP